VKRMPSRDANRSPAANGIERPVEIPRVPRRGAFDRFAERASQFVSKGLFFTIAVVVVAIWMPTIFVFQDIDTWQLVINTLTSVLAFLLIALLQNSERRYDEALHQKIDALAAALADLMEHQTSGDQKLLQRRIDELRSSVGIEREL
jgi:low affinity Fe/Cu permease